MKRMRLTIAALIAWLFFFYNVERLGLGIDITSAAYILVPAIVVITVLVPRLHTVSAWIMLAAYTPMFLLLKAGTGSSIWGRYLAETVAEICALAVTIYLARGLSQGIREFEMAVAHISFGQFAKLSDALVAGEAEIYREVRRARAYKRPLTLLAIGVEEKSAKVALDRMVQEAQQAMIRQYVLSGVSRTLCDELEDYNIIAQTNHHFLILLPEIGLDDLPDVTKRLRKVVEEQVGVTLQIGAAALPADAITFERLVEKAISEMRTDLSSPSNLPGQAETTPEQAIYADTVGEQR